MYYCSCVSSNETFSHLALYPSIYPLILLSGYLYTHTIPIYNIYILYLHNCHNILNCLLIHLFTGHNDLCVYICCYPSICLFVCLTVYLIYFSISSHSIPSHPIPSHLSLISSHLISSHLISSINLSIYLCICLSVYLCNQLASYICISCTYFNQETFAYSSIMFYMLYVYLF